jgi:adenine deaminase
MKKEEISNLIQVASGREKADTVIKNCKIVNVYTAEIIEGDIAIKDGKIAGIGEYEGVEIIDAAGSYAIPGLIDSHIHIESAFVTPGKLGAMVVPCGTTTIIADPHEIVNVCGIPGFEYMVASAKETVLDIKYQIPSCVPATPFENSGAQIDSGTLEELLSHKDAFGVGEMMNFPGVVYADDEVIAKIGAARNANKVIDGHAPGLTGKELNAYVTTGIKTDHECTTVAEMQEKLRLGMYILLREGSASQNLRSLLKGVTKENSHRCLLCSDDRQPKDIYEKGHVDNQLRICVEEGIEPITAIRMATLNSAECYGLSDRGAIAPGLRGDIVLVNNLEEFKVKQVYIEGKLVAEDKKYLGKSVAEKKKYEEANAGKVAGSIHVKDFNPLRLNLNAKSNSVKVIGIIPGEIVTKSEVAKVQLTANGDFIYDSNHDIAKIVIVERHQMTGNVAVGLLKGYGINKGAVATTVAHDSHNIVAVGVNNEEISSAIEGLIRMNGGVVVIENGNPICSMPLPIGGLMSDQDGQWVAKNLENIQEVLHSKLGVNEDVEPLMALSFMSLPVIPELKITDMGLFDVTKFAFTNIEAEN